jgi:hypothetical protein
VPRQSAHPIEAPRSVGDHAAADLRFIRHAMERSATFTAVPGWGGAAMGATGIAAAIVAAFQPSAARWMAVWLSAALAACTIGVITMRRKAERVGVPMTGPPGRRFAMSLAAPLVAGAALTGGLWARRGRSCRRRGCCSTAPAWSPPAHSAWRRRACSGSA